jgi:DNA-binding transcriptional MocR family regulator
MNTLKLTSQTSALALTRIPEDLFNFTVGQPSEALIPHELLKKAITRVVQSNSDPSMYQYAPQLGPFPTRTALALFLEKTFLYPRLSADMVGMTFGNSLGIATALSALTEAGQSIICEDLTYFLIKAIFTDANLSIHESPVSLISGLDMDQLETAIIRLRPRVVYVNPVHQNPTGSVLPVESREKLLKLSKQHNFYILSDEPYILLSFPESDPSEELTSLSLTAARLFPAGDFKNLLCFGSFSKIVSPGLRCGWVTGHPDTLARISNTGSLASGGGPPSLITEALRSMIAEGEVQEHVSVLKGKLFERATIMRTSLHKYFGDEVSVLAPRGGYFMFVYFKSGIDTLRFSLFCRDEGYRIKFLPGAKCSINESADAGHRSSLRLAFSFYTASEIERGMRLLREAYEAFVSS